MLGSTKKRWWVKWQFTENWIFIYPRIPWFTRGGNSGVSGKVPDWYKKMPFVNTIPKKERRLKAEPQKIEKATRDQARKQLIKDYILKGSPDEKGRSD